MLVGGSGHAVSCSELIENNEQKIVGFFDKSKNATLQKYGYDYLGNDSEIIKYLEHDVMWVVAIGQIKSPIPRMTLFKYLEKSKMKLPPLIAPTAEVLRNTELGLGSMVFHNCVINRGAIIGKNTIINTSSVIEHDVKIGDHCHIGPRSIVLGEAIIEDETFIGAGAIIFPGVQIKKGSIIGAGEIVKND